ncbi:MAG: hypothetical protein WB647_13470 [Roseiarcus sp.]|uniref:hypothetical protein n=1 Tax=Roseiarcus sp. TaxID=1969460 RepID=UPI003C4AEC46
MAAGKIGVVHGIARLVEDVPGCVPRPTKIRRQELEIIGLQRAQKIVVLGHRTDFMSARFDVAQLRPLVSGRYINALAGVMFTCEQKVSPDEYKPALQSPRDWRMGDNGGRRAGLIG